MTGPDKPAVRGGSTETREPGEMDDHMKRAKALTVELRKVLMGLPHPWNKQFHAFMLPLQALQAKLDGIS